MASAVSSRHSGRTLVRQVPRSETPARNDLGLGPPFFGRCSEKAHAPKPRNGQGVRGSVRCETGSQTLPRSCGKQERQIGSKKHIRLAKSGPPCAGCGPPLVLTPQAQTLGLCALLVLQAWRGRAQTRRCSFSDVRRSKFRGASVAFVERCVVEFGGYHEAMRLGGFAPQEQERWPWLVAVGGMSLCLLVPG